MLLTFQAKKLVSVFAISLSIIRTRANIGDEGWQLECVLYIQYLFKFMKDSSKIQALIDSSSKINAIILAYTTILALCVCPTNVGAQKIDEFILSHHGIVLANFQVEDK